MNSLLLLLGGAALLYAIRRKKASGIGKLSDNPLDLESILMGVSRGWYTARPEELAGFGYVVWLAGKKANGEFTEDIYPISKETYQALLDNGIGKLPKRRIYHELQAAQSAGIDLSAPYNQQDAATLRDIATRYAYKGSSASAKPLAEQYFSNLARAYKAIAGTNLPYRESVVYNELGDEILRFRDYGTDEQKVQAAIDELSDGVNDAALYWRIVGDIANGKCKLLWNVTAQQKKAGKRGLMEWLTGRNSDRKYYRGVLASAANGGVTPEAYSHRLWQDTGMQYQDDSQIRDILLEVLGTVSDSRTAKQMLLDQYYSMHQEQEPDYFNPDYEQGRLLDGDAFESDEEIPF